MPIVSSSLTCSALHQIINLISTPFWNIITFYYISCDLEHSPGSEDKCIRVEEAEQQLIWSSAHTIARTGVAAIWPHALIFYVDQFWHAAVNIF